MKSFADRLNEQRTILLDGALGTELARRGFELHPKLWSAAALLTQPELVEQIHLDYVLAGAEVITANTFRTHRRSLDLAGLGHRSADLTRLAVGLAHNAAERADYPVWVAGSQAPLEDCYTPENVPEDETLIREHTEMARNLKESGVDLILVETQNTIREAVAAARVATETGLPVLVSFVCGQDGRLLSGEPLTEAAAAILPFGPSGLLVNCLPTLAVPQAIEELKTAAAGVPIGAYANTGILDRQKGWQKTPMEHPANYAERACQWQDAGAKFIGGCCGTTPEHIQQIRNRITS